MNSHLDQHRDKGASLKIEHMLESIVVPGLKTSCETVNQLIETIKKRLAILDFKRGKDLLWIVFIGGTGTGKSTLFNALCHQELSETGVERPKTRNPVLSIPSQYAIIDKVPTLNQNSIEIHIHNGEMADADDRRHERDHLALIDSPDVDSLDVANRELAEDLYLISDVVVFVTSQEKYADDTPSQFLFRIREEGKPCFFCFNKADSGIEREEVIRFYKDQGIAVERERFFFIPYVASPSYETISGNPDVKDFTDQVYKALGKEASKKISADEEKRSVRTLQKIIARLTEILEDEKRAGDEWLAKLDSLFADTSKEVIEALEAELKEENEEYLKREVKKVFGRYDVLAKPRRFVSQFIRAPLFFLGMTKRESSRSHTKDFRKIQKRVDSNPLISGIHRINRLVLERFSPEDETSPLYLRMREPEIHLDDTEIETLVVREQENLASWLEETFQKLTEGISAGKKFGIYSTSILWGVMILLFEIVVLGGGITLLEAVVDSFIAPFVTKGSAELFAYHEIQKVAREMNKRYRKGLLSIVEEQKERYHACFTGLMAPESSVTELAKISRKLEDSR